MLKSLRTGDRAETSSIGPRGAIRRWPWAVAAFAVVVISLAPLLVVDVPAVLDYPNHLARFYILAHPDDPVLARMYAPHWALLPNLGMDLLGQLLLSVFPPHVGGRILLALSLAAPLAGAAVYARAAFGRWTWWSLGAGVIAFNGIFFLGFMNFLLALGVALAGAGAWRVCRRRERQAIAALGGLLIGLTAFFCHLLGFAYFALLIVADEAEGLLRRRRDGRLAWRHAASAAIMLATALGPTAILYVVTHRAKTGGDGVAWEWRAKLLQWLVPFMTYDTTVTIVTAAVVGSVLILGWRHARRARGVATALAVIGALYLVAPFAAAGGTYVDTRLPLMAALLLFAGLAPRLSVRTGAVVGAAFAILMVGRSAHVVEHWQGRARDLADLRASLAYVEPGARILPVKTDYSVIPAAENGRALPNVTPLDEHLGALAVIERRAFWPSLFADPSQQPLAVRPPYDRIALPLGVTTRWRDLSDHSPATPPDSRHAYLADWRTRFDYVLLVGAKPPPSSTPASLTLIRAGDVASLYRVNGNARDRPH